MSRENELRERFDGRRELSLTELALEFGVPEAEAAELRICLELFAQEYGVTANTLRSHDSIQYFVGPTSSRNLIKGFFDQASIEDSASELNYMLKKRRRKLGRRLEHSPMTVGEYVHAWFGIERSEEEGPSG